MDKKIDKEKLRQRLNRICSLTGGADMDFDKKESIEILTELQKETDALVKETIAYQAFCSGRRYEAGLVRGEAARSQKAVQVSADPQTAASQPGSSKPVVSRPPVPQPAVPRPAVPRPAVSTQAGITSPEHTASQNQTDFERKPGSIPEGPLSAGHVKSENLGRFLSERNVGKYLTGVLASLLILTGIAVLAATFWNYIPDLLKFAFVLLLGFALGGAGMLAGQKAGRWNSFHLSLTGCGIMIIYCGLLASRLAWGLFPDFIVLALLLLWMSGGFLVSRKIHSDLMFGIIQTGNMVSILLTVRLMEIGFSLWIILLFVLSTAVLTSVFANHGFHRFNRAAASLIAIFSYLLLTTRLDSLIRSFPFAADDPAMLSCSLLYLGIFLFSAVLFWLIPYGLKGFKGVAGSLLLILQLQLLAICVYEMTRQMRMIDVLAALISGPAAAILFLLVLSAALIKKESRYLVLAVLAANITIALNDISQALFHMGTFLPAVFCTIVLIYGLKKKAFFLKLAAAISYGLTGVMLLLSTVFLLFATSPDPFAFSLITHGLMICFSLLPALEITRNGIVTSKRRLLLLLGIDGAIYYLYLACYNLDIWAMWGTLAAALLAFLFMRMPACRSDKAWRIHYLVLQILLQLLLWFLVITYNTVWEQALGSGVLLLFGAKLMYEALEERGQKYGVVLLLASCISMTRTLTGVIDLTPLGYYEVLISLTCLSAAVACIVLGFRIRIKPVRTYGLILIILSVLKMVTLDIASSDSIVRVGAFIGGGLLCFGISWVYNRAEKK